MSHAVIALCTCPDRASALDIAKRVVTSKLAACVNLIDGIESIYTWDGELNQDKEIQLVAKTYNDRVDELYKLVKQLHPYDEPEWLVMKVESGSTSYIEWIKSSTRE